MSDNEPEKGKKKFKMPNTYVILFGVICFIAVLSWFVPGGAYELNANGDAISGTYHIVESNPQGLWDVFMAPITGMLGSGAISGAIAISLTILLFGSFLEMMEETGSKVIPMRSSLPEKCFSTLPSADKLIIIQKGEMGYIPSEMQIAGKTAREAADIANDTIGVTKKQEAAMLAGSLFGWQTPAADPKNYDDNGNPIKPAKKKSREYER